jgi:hypothetical protein
MNVEIGAEAAQFPEKEYINWIAVAVHSLFLFTSNVNHSFIQSMTYILEKTITAVIEDFNRKVELKVSLSKAPCLLWSDLGRRVPKVKSMPELKSDSLMVGRKPLVDRYRTIVRQVQNHWWTGTEPLADRYSTIGA